MSSAAAATVNTSGAGANANASAKQPRVVKIVSLEENNLVLHEDELTEILLDKSIANLPVAVICVAGVFRSGKSFLLNFLLNYLNDPNPEGEDWMKKFPDTDNGFLWKAGADRVTTGVSMWSQPFIRTINGERTAVLLFDTQGTFDNQSTMSDNVRVFSLAALFSSLIINNIRNMISEDNLQQLKLFVGFGQFIQEQEKVSGPLQDICFLVRDWQNAGSFPYGLGGGMKYLDSIMSADTRSPELVTLRKDIEQAFQTRSCFLMRTPGDDFLDSCQASQPNFEKLRQDFLNQMQDFVRWAVSHAHAKKVGGATTTCSNLAFLIAQSVNVFNNKDVPKVEGLFDAVARVSHLNAELDAMNEYTEAMKDSATTANYVKPTDLQEIHTLAKRNSMTKYTGSQKLGSAMFSSSFQKALDEKIETRYQEIVQMNARRRGLHLSTPSAFLLIAFVCNLVGSIFYYIGLGILCTVLSSISWLCLVATAVWLYATSSGELGDVREIMDSTVDDALRVVTSHTPPSLAPYLSVASATAALVKKQQ